MNWSYLQSFAVIARTGSLTAAGKILSLDPTTVGRQLKLLEEELGETLFERRRDGHLLTAQGQRLYAEVEKMEEAAARFVNSVDRMGAPSGLIRLSTSEGFGTTFIASRLPDFQRLYPEVQIDLVANSGFLNPSRKEADIAILLARPRRGPLRTRLLTPYHLGIYAGQGWLDQHGMPDSMSAIGNSHLVGYIPDFIYAPELKYLEELHLPEEPHLRSSSINAQAQAIAHGAGVGVIPCFLADGASGLVRLFPDISIERHFWLAVHQDVSRHPRIRAFMDWIVALCETERAILMGET